MRRRAASVSFALVAATGLALLVNFSADASARVSLHGATAPLHRVSPPHGGYSVLLPRDWRFHDASYPSDHATHLWWEPKNALMKMTVVLSGCIGCVTTSNYTKPNPAGELPEGVTSKVRLNKWEMAFQVYTTDDPYPDNGIVIVTHNSKGISGSVIVNLWLPTSQHKLATTILRSLRVAM